MKTKSSAGLADCPGNLGDLHPDLGFKAGSSGAHSAPTMMLADLTALLSSAPAEANRDDFNKRIVEENCLGKKTTSNRWLATSRITRVCQSGDGFGNVCSTGCDGGSGANTPAREICGATTPTIACTRNTDSMHCRARRHGKLPDE
jgi:hypothetical protein